MWEFAHSVTPVSSDIDVGPRGLGWAGGVRSIPVHPKVRWRSGLFVFFHLKGVHRNIVMLEHVWVSLFRSGNNLKLKHTKASYQGFPVKSNNMI